MSAQEGCLQASPPASDGPAEAELLAHELEVLRAVAGVTSVLTYERQRREPLNKTMLKVRIEGRKNPLQVHCSERVPNLLVTARQMIEKVGAVSAATLSQRAAGYVLQRQQLASVKSRCSLQQRRQTSSRR